jgi:hypothetical protein
MQPQPESAPTSAPPETSTTKIPADPVPSPVEHIPPPAAASTSEDNEEEPECGWCKWMKAGGCSTPFQTWLVCVDGVKAQGREDVEQCAAVMGPLWACMEANAAYYTPQLDSLKEGRAERKASEAKDSDELL